MNATSDAPFPAEFSALSQRIKDAKTHQEFTFALNAMTEFLSKQHGISSGAREFETRCDTDRPVKA